MSFARVRQISVVALVAAVGLLGVAGASVDGELNRVVNGGFETGFLSLSLPLVSHFPLVVNGWGTRGNAAEILTDAEMAFEGEHALRLSSRPRAATHLIQDLPLVMTSYRLELAFQAESGAQEVKLLASWDRGDPQGGRRTLTLLLTPEGIEITTSAGSWDLVQPLEPGQWHWLEIVADARTGTHTVSLDGRTAMSLPGLADVPPRTLVLGESGVGGRSSFLYDSIRLAQLAEAELAGLRLEVMTSFAGPGFRPLSARLEAAADTLARGAPALALPELSAARRLLSPDSRGGGSSSLADPEAIGRMRLALDAVIELLQY